MKKILLVLIIALAWPTVSEAAFILNESFTTGSRPASWWVGSNGDYSYATSPAPLEGAYSMQKAADGQDLFQSGAEHTGEQWGHLMFNTPTLPEFFTHFLVLGYDFETKYQLTLNSTGTITMGGCGAFETTVGTISTGTTYHMWWRYKKSTGANDGQMEFWFNTSNDRAGTPADNHVSYSAGICTSGLGDHTLSTSGNATQYIVDTVQWADTDEFAGGGEEEPVGPMALSRPKNNLSLVGYWSFDENAGAVAHDQSGRGNAGDLANISSPSTATSGWNNGKRGKAITLDGSNDTFTVPTYASMSPGASDLSISLWMKTSNAGDVLMASASGNAGTFTDGFGLVIPDGWACSSSAKLYFNMANGTTRDASICSNSVVADGSWKHVVVVADRSDTLKIYINGTLDNTVTSTLTGSVAFTDFVSGSADWQSRFTGSLDDLRLYHRALSATEVTSIYRSGQATVGGGERAKVTGGLAGYWTFNGKDVNWSTNKVSDLSGNNNLGILTNMSTSSSPVGGKIGQGLLFDGTNDYIEVANSSSVNIAGDMTVSAWVYFDSIDSTFRTIAGKWRPGVMEQYLMQIDDNNKIGFWTGNGTTGGNRISSANTMLAGRWYHVAGTVSGSTKTLYINGVQDSTGIGTAPGSSTIEFTIGSKKNPSGTYFEFLNGRIDDVRIYNRALSANDIKQLYGLGGGTVIRQ